MEGDAAGTGDRMQCRRRRRSGIALAAAAAATILASCSSSALAFSPSSSSSSSLSSAAPPSSRRVDVAADDGERPSPRGGGQGRGRSSRVPLGMVSYLEAAVAARPPSRKKTKKPSASSSTTTTSSRVPKIGTNVEIEPRAFTLLDAYSSTPQIDFEILYEGITSSPPPPPSPVASEKKIVASKTARGKSSTMPGFIKDKDEGVGRDGRHRGVVLAGSNVSPSSPLQRRLTARMVRPATTGPESTAKLTKRGGGGRRRQLNSESMYRNSATVPDSLLDYARDFHAVSRVTPREEVELGTRTQEAARLQRLHVDLASRYGRDPTDDEWCAAAGKVNAVALREAIEDGLEAKNQLVASNLRMVQRVVNIYIRNGLGSEYNAGDLMQDGTMALIRAAEKYEPDRGFRFSTYAMYWIRSAVKRSQTTQSRIVSVPQRIHETHKRVAKEEARLRKELGREPTKSELSVACDITVLQLRRCRAAMGQVTFSLDAEVRNTLKPNSGNSRKDTMYDIVEGTVDETEYERTQRLLMKEHLIGTIRRYLLPHEVDLLLLRYGLMDERALPKGMSGPLTIAEVSDLVGLKPDKVRRIIINSQKQLRHLMKEWEDFEYELA